MKKPYIELLRDPRWQQKRLRIMEADHWQCRVCESKTETLNVHHLYYQQGHDPWDYEDYMLITMCESCHRKAPKIQWQRAFLDLNMSEDELLELASQLAYVQMKTNRAMADFYAKHKIRMLRLGSVIDLFESMDDVQDYYQNYQLQFKENYIDG